MITLSQRKTLDFVKIYINDHGYAPTVSEIANGIGVASRGVVHRYLKALSAAGEIHMTPRRHRNIRLVCRDPSRTMSVLGRIAAGKPIEAVLDAEYVDVGSIFVGDRRYALRVKGDSMIDEGILDNDLVVCERADTARNGQIVVALVDNENVTLKRWQDNCDGTVTLLPANAQHQPVTYDINRLQIQGLYMGLIRYGEATP